MGIDKIDGKSLFKITLGQLRYMKKHGYLSKEGLNYLEDCESWLIEMDKK